MASAVHEESILCSRCGLVMVVEYASRGTDASATTTIECPYCSATVQVVLKVAANVALARPHGTPPILRRSG